MKLQHTNNTAKIWAGVIAALLLVALTVTLTGCLDEKIVWDDIILGSLLPAPPSDRGEVHTNSREDLWLDVSKVTDKQFADYIDACKQRGFSIDAKSSSISYTAFNENGYELYISYMSSSSEMSIRLEPPMEMSSIVWPDNEAGKQLPAPQSATGRFSYEYEDSFYVFIGNTTKDDFAAYVKACSDAGFSVNYKKGEDHYYSDNAEGWHVDLRYEGNSVMSIKISHPSKDSESAVATAAATEKAPNDTTKDTADAGGIDPDFKKAMDAYESFMGEYVDFMKKYKANPTDLTLLASYADYMSKYADFVRDFSAWGDKELSNQELAYYIDVQARVNKKLLETAG